MDRQIYTSLTAEELVKAIKDGIKDVLADNHTNSSKENQEEDLISIDEVQKIFKVSKVTIHKWKKQGLIPFYKVNRRLYFKKTEILDSLQTKKRKLEVRR